MRGGAAILLICFSAGICGAQQSRDPDLSYAYPAGGKRGTALDITVGGQHLDGITTGMVTGTGVVVTVTGIVKPMNGKRFDEFRAAIDTRRKEMMDTMKPGKEREEKAADMVQMLQEAGAPEDEIRLFRVTQAQRNNPKRQPNSQLAETVTLHLDIAPDAAKGPRTLRLFGKNGITNPLSILVGDLPELCKPGATETPPASPPVIQFPVILNGQILPGQTDRFVFHAVRGERLVFVAPFKVCFLDTTLGVGLCLVRTGDRDRTGPQRTGQQCHRQTGNCFCHAVRLHRLCPFVTIESFATGCSSSISFTSNKHPLH